ncbi:MAG: hypothetical protein IPH06_13690 [Alphaproteobacteria bacterium]|nr:hypothetical protein [Alphaproteobacteria bacterium]
MRVAAGSAPSPIPALAGHATGFWPMLLMCVALILINAAMGLATAHILKASLGFCRGARHETPSSRPAVLGEHANLRAGKIALELVIDDSGVLLDAGNAQTTKMMLLAHVKALATQTRFAPTPESM